MAIKYYVEINTGLGYQARRNWDNLHDSRDEAEASARRAEAYAGWSARVAELAAVPEHVDHLYRRLGGAADTTSLFE
jgi:hypothetical protein